MRNWIVPLLAGILTTTAPATAKPIKVGQPAPPIELTLTDGTKANLADLRGQVVLINFWATWCVPCRVELPMLDGYYRVMRKHGLRMYAVTTEGSLPLFKLKQLFSVMAMPSAKGIKGISGDMPAVPTNYIIDRSGIVRYAKAGAMTLDDLNRELVPLLREAAPAS
ncbi:TlpA disulfide reductase family protein [Sphingomonas sp. VNH70]|uniref:TlpA family protein disulfide reductase n=1 Tax=Sphingomonas silueang TaxID=3156617 RepID=UPI0032B42136